MSATPTTKRLLYLVRQTPYHSQEPQELVDSLLVAAVFEQQVSVLFVGDGVWQLAAAQTDDPSGLKNMARQWQVLPEYDVRDVYVCADSLARRQLQLTDLCLPAIALDLTAQQQLISRQNVVLND